MNKETIVTSAFNVQLFARCGLAWDRARLARRGWAGEKGAFLSLLRECSPVMPQVRTIEVLAG